MSPYEVFIWAYGAFLAWLYIRGRREDRMWADAVRPPPPAATARLHVSPTYGRPHLTDGEPCWCAPTVTEDGIAVHREEN